MKNAEVSYWAKTKNDKDVNCASDINCIIVSQKHALKVAREIFGFGEVAVVFAIEKYGAIKMFPAENSKAAAGHGVRIEYASGRTRLVKYEY